MNKARKWADVLGIFLIVASAALLAWFEIASLNSIKNATITPHQPTFAEQQMAGMTLRQKVASLLILHASGNNAATLGNFLKQYQPGGLIFMGDNIGPMTASDFGAITHELQTNPQLPYLFATDEEGGIVKRFDQDNLPAAIDLKSLPPSQTETTFRQRSVMLKTAGINLNFGIVADVTSNHNSFIYPRVFGGDPMSVSARVVSAVNGEKGNVLSTLKHFPGHGETTANSHVIVPVTGTTFAQWQARDEQPFADGIAAGAQFVMFGQLTYSSVDPLPATLSKTWHDIIRNRDGFKGVCITDDMLMLTNSGNPAYADPIKNAVDALNAGNTMLLYVLGSNTISPNDLIDGIASAIEKDEIKLPLINRYVRQVLELRHSL